MFEKLCEKQCFKTSFFTPLIILFSGLDPTGTGQSCPAGTSSPSLSASMVALIVVGALAFVGGAAWLLRARIAAAIKGGSASVDGSSDGDREMHDKYEPLRERGASASAVGGV